MLTSVVSSSRSVGRGQVQRGRQRGDPDGLGAHRALLAAPARPRAKLGQAFIGGRETIGELRLGETVFERIGRSRACRLWILRLRCSPPAFRRSAPCRIEPAQRTAAQTAQPIAAQRHRRRQGTTRRGPGRRPVRAIDYLEFRICSDHPPIAPRSHHRQPAYARSRSGDVKLPEKLPTSGSLRRPRNHVAIVGPHDSFRNPVSGPDSREVL